MKEEEEKERGKREGRRKARALWKQKVRETEKGSGGDRRLRDAHTDRGSTFLFEGIEHTAANGWRR